MTAAFLSEGSRAVAEEEHLTKTEARAGTGPRAMRLVLMASIALVVIAFAVVLGFGFL